MRHLFIYLFFAFFAFYSCKENVKIKEDEATIVIEKDDITLEIIKEGFRYGFSSNKGLKIPLNVNSGLLYGATLDSIQKIVSTELVSNKKDNLIFLLTTNYNEEVLVNIKFNSSLANFNVTGKTEDHRIFVLRTGACSPGYGLSDNLIAKVFPGTAKKKIEGAGTEITGFYDDNYSTYSGPRTRTVSNFAIYPTHKFAVINIDPLKKVIRSTKEEVAQGSLLANKIDNMYYFFGTNTQIYQSFLDVRNELGYSVVKPKYAFFGLGWEAFGALGWETNQEMVLEDVYEYVKRGYPLHWGVVGSGFWPLSDISLMSTTSFGMWGDKYPNPQAMKDRFRELGLKIFLGLRITFLDGGPFTQEGIDKGYFILDDNNQARKERISFPKGESYLLDATNPEAVKWYVDLCDQWGVDGFKEDLFGYYRSFQMRDDKLNAVNKALMGKGYYIMGRNAYLSSASDIHRIEDFNYDMDQDRGPINTLALAYAGFPLTYCDIIGGQFGGKKFDAEVSARIKMYLMRNARLASMHPAMSVGKGPWKYHAPKVEEVILDAAKDHEMLLPYIYSQAIRFYKEGYPWTMTPLPIAYSNDENVHYRENCITRGYQWMIGDALMAAPLYGEDYETTHTRDIYFPEGIWYDFETSEKYTGKQLLKDFPMLVEKTPLFVGGTGIVVLNKSGNLKCRIYDMERPTSTVFFAKDGIRQSLIQVEGMKKALVKDHLGRVVKIRKGNKYIEFDFHEGNSYTIY